MDPIKVAFGKATLSHLLKLGCFPAFGKKFSDVERWGKQLQNITPKLIEDVAWAYDLMDIFGRGVRDWASVLPSI